MARLTLLCLALCLTAGLLSAEAPSNSQDALLKVSEPLTTGPPSKTVVATPLGWKPWETVPSTATRGPLRYYSTEGRTHLQVVLQRESLPEGLTVKRLGSPPRAYFDLRHSGGEIPPAVALRTGEIEGLRFGIHQAPDGARLRHVLDLRDESVRITMARLVGDTLVLEATRDAQVRRSALDQPSHP